MTKKIIIALISGTLWIRLYSYILHIYYFFNPHVKIGAKTFLSTGISLNTRCGGEIIIGKNCQLQNGCQFITYGGNIKMGNRCSVNPYTILYGQGNLTIGNDVRIAAHCVIIPSNHVFSRRDIPITDQGLINRGITICDDVWIGCGVRILDGVSIAKGCVIAAGSVVNKSTIEYGIYAGVPAKLIKMRE